MLLVSPDNHLTILEPDGIRHPFDPTALRDCLLRWFLNAGMSENCYLAEELALAIEYAFTHSGRADGCFGRGELDLAVVRVLEDAGLAPVAACYRAGATGVPSVECQVEPATVGAILRHPAGTIFTLATLLFVVPMITEFVPHDGVQDVVRFLPMNLGTAMMAVTAADAGRVEVLTPGAAALALGVWTVVPLAVAALLLRRRDV